MKKQVTGSTNTSSTGFTILELMVAVAIFGFSISAITGYSNVASNMQMRAEQAVLGTELANTAVARLSNIDIVSPLLDDTEVGSLNCFNTNGSCASDHGLIEAEVRALFPDWGAANANANAVEISMDPDAAVPVIWYEGHTFHLVWNVEDDLPMSNMKEISVIVTPKPFDDNSGQAYLRQIRVSTIRMNGDT